jgi:hypothetical protein
MTPVKCAPPSKESTPRNPAVGRPCHPPEAGKRYGLGAAAGGGAIGAASFSSSARVLVKPIGDESA